MRLADGTVWEMAMISLRRVTSLVALVGICGLGLVGCGGEEPTDSLAMPPGPPPGMGADMAQIGRASCRERV